MVPVAMTGSTDRRPLLFLVQVVVVAVVSLVSGRSVLLRRTLPRRLEVDGRVFLVDPALVVGGGVVKRDVRGVVDAGTCCLSSSTLLVDSYVEEATLLVLLG